VVELDDERPVDVVATTDGAVLSHVLTILEVAEGSIALHTDSGVLDDLAKAGVVLGCPAGPVEHDQTDEGACVLVVRPDGWARRRRRAT
jgi:hypothetical protein